MRLHYERVMSRKISFFSFLASSLLAAAFVTGCATASLSPQGAKVAVTRNAPPSDCRSIGYLVGEGGGTFGGGFISNDQLIEYAMNDLRNKAAARGANYIQADPPTLGQGKGETTTATITGTAYVCSGPASSS